MHPDMSTEDKEMIYLGAKDSVTVIDALVARSSLSSAEKDKLSRNVRHLEQIKGYKNQDNSSVWTSEDFTDIDNSITTGNAKLS